MEELFREDSHLKFDKKIRRSLNWIEKLIPHSVRTRKAGTLDLTTWRPLS